MDDTEFITYIFKEIDQVDWENLNTKIQEESILLRQISEHLQR